MHLPDERDEAARTNQPCKIAARRNLIHFFLRMNGRMPSGSSSKLCCVCVAALVHRLFRCVPTAASLLQRLTVCAIDRRRLLGLSTSRLTVTPHLTPLHSACLLACRFLSHWSHLSPLTAPLRPPPAARHPPPIDHGSAPLPILFAFPRPLSRLPSHSSRHVTGSQLGVC